ncbi:MAG TPA: preprotein translocase subunit YajC [Jatrophihabitantaceae bacterium]|jgi:preprotein translocase subunit YajC|nr:preprotein translocase subunit YajC [Jatrophihabitantaceae bacterium]
MSYAYLVILVLLVGMLFLSMRNRRRQAAAEAERVQQIEVGTEVMTTSGLYGTVVAKGGDGTVVLAIAPGVEVKWALAALRDVASLPDQFQGPNGPGGRGGIYDRPDDSDTGHGTDWDPDNRDS